MTDRTDAQRVADTLEPYVRHKPDCTYSPSPTRSPGDDYCDCGLDAAVETVQYLIGDT